MIPLARLRLGNLPIDRVTGDEVLHGIATMVVHRRGGTIFTPNVDHIVLASTDERLRRAYDAVDLALADGMPVVWASRLLGLPVPQKVSGSDLAPRLMELAAERGWRVFLLGGGSGVALRAASRLQEAHPTLRIVGVECPRVEVDEPAAERARLVDRIKRTAPDLVLVGLGAPKQELWIHATASALHPAVLIGVGASIDMLAGVVKRAPPWMSSAGLEWLFRLALEPRRLWRRYLVRDPKFLVILARELSARWWGRPGPRSAA